MKRVSTYNSTNDKINFSDYITPGSIPGLGANINKCDYNQPPPPGKVCDVDVKNWYPCTKENKYNYHKSAPCIFLKLNKVTFLKIYMK